MIKSVTPQTIRRNWKKCFFMAAAALVFQIAVPDLSPFGIGPAAAKTSQIHNLAPSGWARDESLLTFSIDRYLSASGTLDLSLMAFPQTNESAADWSQKFIDIMTKPDGDAGLQVHVIDEDEMKAGTSTGPMNTSEPGLDMATRSIMVIRRGGNNLMLRVRTMVREGKPVQVSLLKLLKGNATDAEYSVVSKIAYNARMPLNQVADIFDPVTFIELMTGPLIYPDVSPVNTETTQAAIPSTTDVAEAPANKSNAPVSAGSSKQTEFSNVVAPQLIDMPGPRVEYTGKYLKSLPAGYRMNVNTTNYWTNSSMTATRQLHLTLTRDGQFEESHFSISGGMMGGGNGVVSTGNKHGTTGSVYGDTNPYGSGTKSVAMHKRDGLDPSKYGTYYISDKQIEMRYANGKVVTRTFVSDGFYSFDMDGKKYFSSAPDTWERTNRKDYDQYRRYDGSYLANVIRIKKDVENGVTFLNNWLERMKTRGAIVNSTPVKWGKSGSKLYAWTTADYYLKDTDQVTEKQVYIRYGRDSRLIAFIPYKNAKGLDVEVDFVRYVN